MKNAARVIRWQHTHPGSHVRNRSVLAAPAVMTLYQSSHGGADESTGVQIVPCHMALRGPHTPFSIS